MRIFEKLWDWNKKLKSKKNVLTCQDCNSEKFYGGPKGGMSENIMCMDCGSAFNFSGMELPIDRISNGWWTDAKDPAMRAALTNGEPAPQKNSRGEIDEFGYGEYQEEK